ncbi:MAG: YeeE/YedE family protein [Hyphomicrobiaceae bacterium]
MDLIALIEWLGEGWTLAAGGLIIGSIFGAFAQQSRFCLRAAAVEFARGSIGAKTSVWLLVFTVAVFGTQLLEAIGAIATNEARQIASPQTVSGAAIGGLMFGVGMVLARGCASRLLVLSATGNLRALLSGLVFAVFAQASLKGFLSPAREAISDQVTTLSIGGNDLLNIVALTPTLALVLSGLAAVLAIVLARRVNRVGAWVLLAALAVGTTIPLAWGFTTAVGRVAFDPVTMTALTFTGPSADTLMLFLSPPGTILGFDVGLVPGVFLGSFLAAWLSGELKLQGFEGGAGMPRYLTGAAMMGFGGMLAGGCAVGAGVTGASVFAITAWITLFAIWLAAGVTDRLVDAAERRDAIPLHPAAGSTGQPLGPFGRLGAGS